MGYIEMKVGQSYVNRQETEVVTIVRYDESEPLYRFIGDNGLMYAPGGGYCESLGAHPYDLINPKSKINELNFIEDHDLSDADLNLLKSLNK